MKKIKIGVMGVGRGSTMIAFCKAEQNVELVAICDKYEEGLNKMKAESEGFDITYYTDFDEFIKHDMDGVVLANYANEHAPFAIKAMKAGKHVFSEVLPCQTLKEAVELIETVEETGKIYAYGENYCYMSAPYEMKKLYEEGKIGEIEYAEGEYVHNCESIWPDITYGDKNHWRNHMYSTFYCTHSMGPIIHITGLRPVSVVGFEGTMNERRLRTGAKGGSFGMEMVTLENGAIVKSLHGDLYKSSVWYSLYGSKGRLESARRDTENGYFNRIFVNADAYSGEYAPTKIDTYMPRREHDERAVDYGHGSSDFHSMHHFVKAIAGDKDADVIDVFEAMDMFLPGLFAYRSILAGGVPVEIPNFRDKAVREQYRNDTACTDPKVAGDQLLPTTKNGTPEIEDAVYDLMYKKWRENVEAKKKEIHKAE